MSYLTHLIIILTVLLYGLLHSTLAALGTKARARTWFGPGTDRWYRLFYNGFGVLTFLPVLALVAWLPDQELYRIPRPWVYLALIGQLLAVVVLAIGVMQTGAMHFLGFAQLFEDTESQPRVLVTSGLYRRVRHPLYTAGLVFIWLAPVMTANLLALNIGLTAYLILGALYEERKLVIEYGKEYERYRRRTPMLVPGLRSSSSNSSDVLN